MELGTAAKLDFNASLELDMDQSLTSSEQLEVEAYINTSAVMGGLRTSFGGKNETRGVSIGKTGLNEGDRGKHAQLENSHRGALNAYSAPGDSLTEETEALFVQLQSSCRTHQKDSEGQLSLMISSTAETKKRLQEQQQALDKQQALLDCEHTKMYQYLTLSHKLHRASHEITDFRATRPARDEGYDEVQEALERQSHEINHTVELTERHLEELDAEAARVSATRSAMQQDIVHKTRGLRFDTTARALQAGDGHGDEMAHSELEHEAWVDHTQELLVQAAQRIEASTERQAECVELRRARAAAEAQYSEECSAALYRKQAEWKEGIQEMQGEITRIKAQIKEHEKLHAQGLRRQIPLKEAQLRAESRLAQRNRRPCDERKHDGGEDALLAELCDNEAMQHALHQQLDKLQDSIAQCKQRSKEIMSELRDAESARDIDATCLKMQYKTFSSKKSLTKLNYSLNKTRNAESPCSPARSPVYFPATKSIRSPMRT